MNTIHFCLLFCIYHMDSLSLSSEMIIKSLQNKKGLKIFQLPTFRCFFSAASCRKRHQKRCSWKILDRKIYKPCTHLQSTASHRYRTCLEHGQLASIKFSELRCAANFKDLIRAGHNLISMFRLLSFSPPPVMITFSLCNFTLEFFFHNRFSRLNREYQRGHWPPQFFVMIRARPSQLF